jgi:hypothetical protein
MGPRDTVRIADESAPTEGTKKGRALRGLSRYRINVAYFMR